MGRTSQTSVTAPALAPCCRAGATLLALLLLAGCGQKGPLILPENARPAAPASAPAAR
jgi:predicted small lipoprotein YifL